VTLPEKELAACASRNLGFMTLGGTGRLPPFDFEQFVECSGDVSMTVPVLVETAIGHLSGASDTRVEDMGTLFSVLNAASDFADAERACFATVAVSFASAHLGALVHACAKALPDLSLARQRGQGVYMPASASSRQVERKCMKDLLTGVQGSSTQLCCLRPLDAVEMLSAIRLTKTHDKYGVSAQCDALGLFSSLPR
jgi:hypothetical protein